MTGVRSCSASRSAATRWRPRFVQSGSPQDAGGVEPGGGRAGSWTRPTSRRRERCNAAYGSGLRVSEVVGLRGVDIDSKRMIMRIVQAKGRKDRQ